MTKSTGWVCARNLVVAWALAFSCMPLLGQTPPPPPPRPFSSVGGSHVKILGGSLRFYATGKWEKHADSGGEYFVSTRTENLTHVYFNSECKPRAHETPPPVIAASGPWTVTITMRGKNKVAKEYKAVRVQSDPQSTDLSKSKVYIFFDKGKVADNLPVLDEEDTAPTPGKPTVLRFRGAKADDDPSSCNSEMGEFCEYVKKLEYADKGGQRFTFLSPRGACLVEFGS